MTLSGTIKLIEEELTYGGSFRKRNLVVTTDEQYPQHILVEFHSEKCDLLNMFNVGEPVILSINLRGREWTNPQGEVKYFNSIQAWRIDRPALQQQAQTQHQPQQQPAQYESEVDKYNAKHGRH